jgi:hypothetical protein
MADGKLVVHCVDVHGAPARGNVSVLVRSHSNTKQWHQRDVPGTSRLDFLRLPVAPAAIYTVQVTSDFYLPVGRFVNLHRSGATELTITLPINPEKVRVVVFPKYDDLSTEIRVLLSQSGNASDESAGMTFYSSLGDTERCGLLNILAKTSAVRLSSGRLVVAGLKKITRVKGDRLYIDTDPELFADAASSAAAGLLNTAPGGLHAAPAGYKRIASFKTSDAYGNLQLTFFNKGNKWQADIDIDDANGLEHIFQVLRNTMKGRPTHPYDIHQILTYHQSLDPGYRFDV